MENIIIRLKTNPFLEKSLFLVCCVSIIFLLITGCEDEGKYIDLDLEKREPLHNLKNNRAFTEDNSLRIAVGSMITPREGYAYYKTIGPALDESSQWKIKNVLITHAHLDHIKDIPFFADNISIRKKKHHVTIMSIPYVIRAIKKNLLNDIVWPDFTIIPTPEDPIIRLKSITAHKPFRIDGYRITAYRVNHTVPAVGYLVENNKGKSLLYLGDSGPNERIWKSLDGRKLNTLIIEVSLPNRFKDIALKTGHLTPKLLEMELKKMEYAPDNVFITHCKPAYKAAVIREIGKLSMKNVKLFKDGKTYEF